MKEYTFPFSYEVVVYAGAPDEYSLEAGIGFCSSYADAAQQVEEYFGAELISFTDLYLFEDSTLLPMPRSFIRELKRIPYVPSVRCDSNGNPFMKAEVDN